MSNSQDRVDILNLLNLIINRDMSNNTLTHDLIDNSSNTLTIGSQWGTWISGISSGNVGIGITAPISLLHIYENSTKLDFLM